MRLLTSGSRLEIPTEIMQRFEGIVGGYFWQLWGNPSLQDYALKYGKTEIRSGFLYGNQHRKPDPASGCTTIDEWVAKRVSTYSYVNEWVLVNEFINDRDNYNPYPGYGYENIKRYLRIAHESNPEAKLIIADFRPYQLERWRKIKEICDRLLSEDVPLHGVGIQVHFKTRNAHSPIPGVPYILDALPTVIDMFKGLIPVHLTEVSGWRHYSENRNQLSTLWNEVISIAVNSNVESFCPWWLNEYDENFPRAMPSFEEFVGAGIYDREWRQRYRLV